MSTNLMINTDDFDGPLDLLVYLTDNKKIDLSQIIISDIIDDYLEIIKKEKELKLKTKVEFLIMASNLLEIKAHSILNKDKTNDKGIDLEKRIYEYKVIKEIAKNFSNMEVEFNISHKFNGKLEKNKEKIYYTIDDLKLDRIRDIFLEIISKETYIGKITIDIMEDFTTENALFLIESEFNIKNYFSFSSILKGNFSKIRIVSFFLAILDLYKLGTIDIDIIDNDFYIRKVKNV